MTRPPHWTPIAAALVAAHLGCGQLPADGGPEPDGPDCTIEGDERFLPLVEGASWTLDTIDLTTGVTETRTQTVGALADVGGAKAGVMAFPFRTVKNDGEVTVWQEDTGTAVVRHRQVDRAGGRHKDDIYQPFKGRLDESPDRLKADGTWEESYVATSTDLDSEDVTTENRTERWTVLRYGEEVEVPAGTFCTVRVERVRTTDGVVGRPKHYWFARGVGKVKERAGNDREVLVDYDIP